MTDSEKKLKLTVNGKEVESAPGEMLIAAAEKAGVLIPRFCYHPRLEPVGVCRMCLVEVKGPRGFTLQPACYISVSDGMEVVTDSEKAKKAQDGVLEFLLANHPLDCPVCDKGGECPLQDQTLTFGPSESRFVEEKRHFEKPIAISKLVYLDRERCIQCDRCTRFAADIAGEALIDFEGRGGALHITTFPDKPFASYFSGNTAQICPVGALTTTPYRFKARPWDLEQVESTCVSCAVGCQMVVQSSENEIVRYLGIDSEAVNQSWLCDKGRFGFESVSSAERIPSPYFNEPSGMVETGWSQALDAIAKALKSAEPESVALIGGSHMANEDIYAWVKLTKGVIGTDSIDAQLDDGLDPKIVALSDRATIQEATQAKLLILMAGDLREELPILYLRIRSAAKKAGLKILEISLSETSLSNEAEVSLRYFPGYAEELVNGLFGAEVDPQFFAGDLQAARALVSSVDPASVVVVGARENLADSSLDPERAIAKLLDSLVGSKFLSGLRRGNVNGAIDMGMVPGLVPGRGQLQDGNEALKAKWKTLPRKVGRNSREILESALRGEIKVLFLVGADLISDFSDSALAEKALGNIPMVVGIDSLSNRTTAYCSVVLPATAFAERHGSTTNIEGRVSTLGKKLVGFSLSRPEWMIAVELAAYMGEDLGFESLHDIWGEIQEVSQLHRGLSIAALGAPGAKEGIVVPLSASKVQISNRRVLDPIATPGITSVGVSGPPSSSAAIPGEGDPVLSESTYSRQRSKLLELLAHDDRAKAGPEADNFALVVSKRLYDHGVEVMSAKHLSELVVPSKGRVSPKGWERIGLNGSGLTRLQGNGASVELELVVDPSLLDGVVKVEFDGALGEVSKLFGVENSTSRVKMEKV